MLRCLLNKDMSQYQDKVSHMHTFLHSSKSTRHPSRSTTLKHKQARFHSHTCMCVSCKEVSRGYTGPRQHLNFAFPRRYALDKVLSDFTHLISALEERRTAHTSYLPWDRGVRCASSSSLPEDEASSSEGPALGVCSPMGPCRKNAP